MKRTDALLLGAAMVCGAGFLVSLDRLWPVADLPISTDARILEGMALEHQSAVGQDLGDWSAESQLVVDEPALSWLERTRSRRETQDLLSELPVYLHEVQFKKAGNPGVVTFWIHPSQGLVGWNRTTEDDEAGPRLDSAHARAAVLAAVREHIGQDLSGWELRRREVRHLDSRDDQTFVFQRAAAPGSDVEEQMTVWLAGASVREVRPSVVVPPAWIRQGRRRQFLEQFVQAVAFSVFASMGVAAFLYKLWAVRRGLVGFKIPAIGAGLVVFCMGAVRLLRGPRLFELWDPVGPRWMSAARTLLQGAISDLLPALMVFCFVAASDALDQEAPRHRGIALRNFLRLRWNHVGVGHASLRGFLLGWVAGGVLALATWGMSHVPGALVELQPRGFFFYGLNSSHPTLLLALFFLQISLVEELGYRHFAGNAILRLGLGRWAAACLPALVYGAVHCGESFLPPADPWWARIVPITLVGILWGWAFIRWDALTVVLSHWACDLFLFNRTRILSDDPWTRLSAVGCIAIPLLPAAVAIGWRAWERLRKRPDPEPWGEDSDLAGFDPGTEPELAATVEPDDPTGGDPR